MRILNPFCLIYCLVVAVVEIICKMIAFSLVVPAIITRAALYPIVKDQSWNFFGNLAKFSKLTEWNWVNRVWRSFE